MIYRLWLSDTQMAKLEPFSQSPTASLVYGRSKLMVEEVLTDLALCNDSLKNCSCYKEGNSNEYDDGREHQTLDSIFICVLSLAGA
jgi:UDP-glucose 4-epimerase